MTGFQLLAEKGKQSRALAPIHLPGSLSSPDRTPSPRATQLWVGSRLFAYWDPKAAGTVPPQALWAKKHGRPALPLTGLP